MKPFDILAAVLLIVGGLNWGLYGLFGMDLVARLFGGSILATIVYTLVGLAAVYQVIGLTAIQRRRGVGLAAS